jgi:curli biogenesis system outer membrane secretion channel CsgG
MRVLFLSLLVSIFFFSGCMKNENLDIQSYTTRINSKLLIPNICKKEYQYTLPKVAVLDLVNNTTYNNAKIDKLNSSGAVGLGFGITGFVAGAKSNKSNIKRDIQAKLSQSITPLLENIVSNTGGAILYTRSELDRVNDELKLQESGILDSSTVVQFGKLSGVQYLITGTIDNVSTNYRGYSKYTKKIDNVIQNNIGDKNTKLASSAVSFLSSMIDGTDIKTNITIKVIDVSSGKIIFTTPIEEKIKVSGDKEPTYDQVISGIKESIKKAMPQLESEFSKYFKVQGYITKLRKKDDKLIAQINLGSNKKIKKDDKFNLYTLEENIDPLTNIKSCEKIKLPNILTTSEHINQTHSWVQFDEHNTNNIKLLQIVQKAN